MVVLEKLRSSLGVYTHPIMVKSEDCDKGILTVHGKMITYDYSTLLGWKVELKPFALNCGKSAKIGSSFSLFSDSFHQQVQGNVIRSLDFQDKYVMFQSTLLTLTELTAF